MWYMFSIVILEDFLETQLPLDGHSDEVTQAASLSPSQVCVAVVAGWCCLPAASQTLLDGPLLSTFKGVTQRESRGPLGSYQFSFSLPQQERVEHRDEQGKVCLEAS